MTITSFTGLKPPLSCVIDGLQIATPCTVGNGGIVIQNEGQARVRVAGGSRELEISLKPPVHGEIKAAVGTDRLEELALRLWGSAESELLDVSESETEEPRLVNRDS